MRLSTTPILLLAFAAMLCAGCSSFRQTPSATMAGGNTYGVEPVPLTSPHVAPPALGLGELRYAVESEHIAKDAQCSTQPTAHLLAKGPGFETYTIPCGSTQIMLIRCDFSYCRTMR